MEMDMDAAPGMAFPRFDPEDETVPDAPSDNGRGDASATHGFGVSACKSARIVEHLRAARYDAPTLLLDVGMVGAQYDKLARGAAPAEVFYAVKANPERAILETLARRGSRFDVASRGEIDLVLAAGATAETISFGNTIKKSRDIAHARRIGVDLFVFDSEEELHKIAAEAPGAEVFCRLLIEHSQAEWPLSRKFGCPPAEAVRLLSMARGLGLRAGGLSFHGGSQAREAVMWTGALDTVAGTYGMARAAGLDLTMLNLGGGFPAEYLQAVPDTERYAREVIALARARFGELPARLMIEPGRAMVAEAGLIVAETVLVSRKSPTDLNRWVYLDIGKFGGLAETIDEAIRYRIETPHDGGATGPCILAGPTCDSADVLYEKRPVTLPMALRSGDPVRIVCTGAYTTTYASVAFNGIAPLDVVCL